MVLNRTKRGFAEYLDLRRRLRSHMTPAENKLWFKLKGKQFQNLKFRRQHGVGAYIVDFYCSEKKLIIEIDGDVHAQELQQQRDEKREMYLKSLDGVLEDLLRNITSTSP